MPATLETDMVADENGKTCARGLLPEARHQLTDRESAPLHRHFQNVPLRETKMPTPLKCALCGHLCSLEECTMDERGRAVHYQCLADQIVRQDNVANPKPN
jgi:hypothetical protein